MIQPPCVDWLHGVGMSHRLAWIVASQPQAARPCRGLLPAIADALLYVALIFAIMVVLLAMTMRGAGV